MLAQHDFAQPMLGRDDAGSFAHTEVYLCGVYDGWLSATGAARLTDHARATYALRNF